MSRDRRSFIKNTVLGSVGMTVGINGLSAKSYKNIIGANDRVRTAIMGVNNRGRSLAKTFSEMSGNEIVYICDVDERAVERTVSTVASINGRKPKGIKDFRTILDDSELDALVIAAPDHWHAPAAILACNAGKHVYVEKPCSHNPGEGELLIKAAEESGRVVQMGNQRRSWPNLVRCVQEIKEGVIGRVYFAKGWYANGRKSIGTGKHEPVPEWLNYELWQGPAPRRDFKNNLIHYNWHWHWHWGTGEALNNGTHEVDLMRWALSVEYPLKVTSAGGRYHYNDDWETPDTQVITYDFDGKISMEWEGRSCNPRTVEGSGRGVVFYGEKGSIVNTGGNSYTVYDNKNQVVKEVRDTLQTDTQDTTGPGKILDAYHLSNFLESIKGKEEPNSPINEGHKSVLLCQLGNIAHRTGSLLICNQNNGHILNNDKAMEYWSRSYEPGWEPKL